MSLPRILAVGSATLISLVLAGGAAAQTTPGVPESRRGGEASAFNLGLYPGVSAVLGPPNWLAWGGSVYVSISSPERFSLFVGYGEEHGGSSDSQIYTLGMGGVRALPAAVPQNGFHGKFLRYRRIEHDRHGLHHGLSIGTETGVGVLSITFEVGAARSGRNHWLFTAQVALKVGLPILLPVG